MRHTGLDSGPPMQFFKNPRPMRGPTPKYIYHPRPGPENSERGGPTPQFSQQARPTPQKIARPHRERAAAVFSTSPGTVSENGPSGSQAGAGEKRPGAKRSFNLRQGQKLLFIFALFFQKTEKRPQPRERWLGTLRKMQNFLAFYGPRGYNRGAGKIKAGHEGVPPPSRPYAGDRTSHTADLLRQLPL